jgi:DNA-binding MarR family transcriptional regulator
MMSTSQEADINSQDLSNLDRVVHEPARLMILMYLYTLESADFVFLLRATELTWGNLSSHLTKLEDAEYVQIEKEFVGRKPRTLIKLTKRGREAVKGYRRNMQEVLNNLKD